MSGCNTAMRQACLFGATTLNGCAAGMALGCTCAVPSRHPIEPEHDRSRRLF